MAKGGRRRGAGRPPGSATKRTREIADRAAAAGITPLEMMLGAAEALWRAGKKTEAASIAKDSAPYCHPRLAAIELTGKDGDPIAISVVERRIVRSGS